MSSKIRRVSQSLVLRAVSVRRASRTTRIVRLALDGARFRYRAGQAALVGPAERDERIPYSLASAPEETERDGWLEFLIKIEPSGRWGHLFDRLARGMRLAVRGPIGAFVFPDAPTERRFLFIAGGTGIAPVRSMVRHVLLSTPPGRVRVLYSARTPDDFSYLPELRGMARRKAIELALTATREVLPGWRGARGRITARSLAPLVDHPETLCFVCGPTAMVTDVPVMLNTLGINGKRIRVEQW